MQPDTATRIRAACADSSVVSLKYHVIIWIFPLPFVGHFCLRSTITHDCKHGRYKRLLYFDEVHQTEKKHSNVDNSEGNYRVALPRGNESQPLYLAMSGTDVSHRRFQFQYNNCFQVMQIGMPRETPFIVVERINEIAMKLFNWDLVSTVRNCRFDYDCVYFFTNSFQSNGFWLRRYIPARSHYLIDELVNAHNLPDSSFEVSYFQVNKTKKYSGRTAPREPPASLHPLHNLSYRTTCVHSSLSR